MRFGEVFTPVFVTRFIIGLVITTGVVWGLSFKVADYVVKANTSSANAAMGALQGSIEVLTASIEASNEAILANVNATNALQQQLNDLMSRSVEQSASLASLSQKVDSVAAAVQDAGIDIRVGGDAMTSQVLPFATIARELDIDPSQDAYIKVPLKMWTLQDGQLE